MSSKVQATEEELDNILSFYNRWLDGEIAELAQDSEREILRVPYPKLQKFDSGLTDSWFEALEVAQIEFEAALQRFSLPIDANFEEASVALTDLPAYHTYYPGEFSPTEAGGQCGLAW